ncbi:MAG: hypothetical protein JXQ89_21665 [Pelagimonas sp.]
MERDRPFPDIELAAQRRSAASSDRTFEASRSIFDRPKSAMRRKTAQTRRPMGRFAPKRFKQ